jgi:hypothetical protein
MDLQKTRDYALKPSVRMELEEEGKTLKGAKRFADPEKAKGFLRTCVK